MNGGRFSDNGTDFANGKRDFGTKFTAVLHLVSHLPKPCTDRFAYEKAKPATVIPQPNF